MLKIASGKSVFLKKKGGGYVQLTQNIFCIEF